MFEASLKKKKTCSVFRLYDKLHNIIVVRIVVLIARRNLSLLYICFFLLSFLLSFFVSFYDFFVFLFLLFYIFCIDIYELNTKLLVLFFAGNVCYFSSGLGSAEGKLTNTIDQTFVVLWRQAIFQANVI